MAAGAAVLQTSELLEMILVHLSMKDITKVRAVCRQSRDLVASSSQLKRATFRVPNGERFLRVDRAPTRTNGSLGKRDLTKTLVRADFEPCPIFTPGHIKGFQARREKDWTQTLYEFKLSTQFLQTMGTTQDDFLRGMLLTQPPCTTIAMDLEVKVRYLDRHLLQTKGEVSAPWTKRSSEQIVEAKGGITIGSVMDVVDQKMAQLSVGSYDHAVEPEAVCLKFWMR